MSKRENRVRVLRVDEHINDPDILCVADIAVVCYAVLDHTSKYRSNGGYLLSKRRVTLTVVCDQTGVVVNIGEPRLHHPSVAEQVTRAFGYSDAFHLGTGNAKLFQHWKNKDWWMKRPNAPFIFRQYAWNYYGAGWKLMQDDVTQINISTVVQKQLRPPLVSQHMILVLPRRISLLVTEITHHKYKLRLLVED